MVCRRDSSRLMVGGPVEAGRPVPVLSLEPLVCPEVPELHAGISPSGGGGSLLPGYSGLGVFFVLALTA